MKIKIWSGDYINWKYFDASYSLDQIAYIILYQERSLTFQWLYSVALFIQTIDIFLLQIFDLLKLVNVALDLYHESSGKCLQNVHDKKECTNKIFAVTTVIFPDAPQLVKKLIVGNSWVGTYCQWSGKK